MPDWSFFSNVGGGISALHKRDSAVLRPVKINSVLNRQSPLLTVQVMESRPEVMCIFFPVHFRRALLQPMR